MTEDRIELDLDKLEARGISRYKAVLMAAQEARFINDQIRLGIIEEKEKSCTTALKRLYEGRVVEDLSSQDDEE